MADAALGWDAVKPFAISLALGALVGVERERHRLRDEEEARTLPGGVRTFPLIAVLGCSLAWLGAKMGMPVFAVGLAGFAAMIVAVYVVTSLGGDLGMTTEVAGFVTFCLGAMVFSGAELLAAYIGGVEAGARIAAAVKSGLHQVGFHPTGVVGAFAASLVAGRLMKLSPQRLTLAQGVALSLASGSLQFIEDGSWTKRMHPGWAAASGITAAALAADDFPAPREAYEGRFGFYRSHLPPAVLDACDFSLASARLGEAWEIDNIAVKPFPACHFVHACAEAAIALHRAGVDPERVRSIRAVVPEGVVQAVCEPVAAKRRPRSDYDAKFSLPYAVASGLDMRFADAQDYEATLIGLVSTTEDMREGTAAFLEKRKAEFKGR